MFNIQFMLGKYVTSEQNTNFVVVAVSSSVEEFL
jgi:hypothetical protein